MYEPEQFPGLIHRMLDPKTVIFDFLHQENWVLCLVLKKKQKLYRSVNNVSFVIRRKRFDGLRLNKNNLFNGLPMQYLQ